MSQEMLTGLIPAAIILVIVIARVVFVNSGRGGSDGFAGMAVCRKCGRSFSRSFLAPNLITGKLVRCPHCGAWGILPAASQAELDVAQAREKKQKTLGTAAIAEEEALRRRIEQSKYE